MPNRFSQRHDEHAAAAYQVHTGRPVSGTIQYPSVGSIVAHEKGTLEKGVPRYVVIGYPSISRTQASLALRLAFFIYSMLILVRGFGCQATSPPRWKRREDLLRVLRSGYVAQILKIA